MYKCWCFHLGLLQQSIHFGCRSCYIKWTRGTCCCGYQADQLWVEGDHNYVSIIITTSHHGDTHAVRSKYHSIAGQHGAWWRTYRFEIRNVPGLLARCAPNRAFSNESAALMDEPYFRTLQNVCNIRQCEERSSEAWYQKCRLSSEWEVTVWQLPVAKANSSPWLIIYLFKKHRKLNSRQRNYYQSEFEFNIVLKKQAKICAHQYPASNPGSFFQASRLHCLCNFVDRCRLVDGVDNLNAHPVLRNSDRLFRRCCAVLGLLQLYVFWQF